MMTRQMTCVCFRKREMQAFKPSKEITLKIRVNAVSERIIVKVK